MRLNEAPWCPKCGKKTTWKARAEHGMCPVCHRRWTIEARTVSIQDVRQHHVVFIRYRHWQGRRAKGNHWSSTGVLEKIVRELNRPATGSEVDYRVEGKNWGLALVAYIVSSKNDFMPCHYVFLPGRKGKAYGGKPQKKSIPHDYHPYPLRDDDGRIICRRCPGYEEEEP